MTKAIQAKDIPVPELLAAVEGESSGWTMGASWWTLAVTLGYPEKVVLARLRALVRRGLVDGCPCGCRGDFRLTDLGREALAEVEA